LGECLEPGDRKIEVFVYLSPPSADYLRLHSPGLRDLFPALSPSISRVITFLNSYIGDTARKEVGTPNYFIKSFRSGDLNYIAIGRWSSEVNRSRGQAAPYVYMFILKTSEYLRYPIDLERLLRKVRSYEELYSELETGASPTIESVPLDEVSLTDYKEDRRAPDISSRQGGYIIYADSLEEALRRLGELYRNVWLRLLFDFLVIRGYGRSPPPGTIVISYGASGFEESPRLMEGISLNVEDACRSLARRTGRHDVVVERDPCTVLDYVKDYREEVKKFIGTNVRSQELLQAVKSLISSIESTPFTMENLANHVKLLEDLSKYREKLSILGLWEKYYDEALDKLKGRMRADLGLNTCINLANYVRQKKGQPAGKLEELSILSLAQRECESLERELPEKVFNILHGVLVEHRQLSGEDIAIIKYAVEKKLFSFGADSLRGSPVYSLVLDRGALLDYAARRFVERSKNLVEDFLREYESFSRFCDELRGRLEELGKRLSEEGLKDYAKDMGRVLLEGCSALERAKNSVKGGLKEMENRLKRTWGERLWP